MLAVMCLFYVKMPTIAGLGNLMEHWATANTLRQAANSNLGLEEVLAARARMQVHHMLSYHAYACSEYALVTLLYPSNMSVYTCQPLSLRQLCSAVAVSRVTFHIRKQRSANKRASHCCLSFTYARLLTCCQAMRLTLLSHIHA